MEAGEWVKCGLIHTGTCEEGLNKIEGYARAGVSCQQVPLGTEGVLSCELNNVEAQDCLRCDPKGNSSP